MELAEANVDDLIFAGSFVHNFSVTETFASVGITKTSYARLVEKYALTVDFDAFAQRLVRSISSK